MTQTIGFVLYCTNPCCLSKQTFLPPVPRGRWSLVVGLQTLLSILVSRLIIRCDEVIQGRLGGRWFELLREESQGEAVYFQTA